MKINNLYLFPLIFLFFPAFCLLIGPKPIVIYYIILTAVFVFGFFFFYKRTLKIFRVLYKISPLKYFLFFALWIILSGLILVMKGGYRLNVFLYYILALLFVDYFLTYLLPSFAYNPKHFNIKSFIKLMFILYFVILSIAILEFIGKKTGLTILTFPSEFLGNQRNLIGGGTLAGHYLDRVRSVFAEPGWLGCFLFINLPIIYSISRSKYTLYKNKFWNFYAKKLIIPMTWLTIFIEQSAIWLIFCIILTAVYFRKYIFKLIMKYFSILLIFLLIIGITGIMLFSFMGTSADIGYYGRILNFFQNMTSFENLVESDHSLGARLISYYLSIKTGLNHIWLGVGIGNLKYRIAEIFSVVHVPYSFEVYDSYQHSFEKNSMNYNGSILYEYFAELGIFGLGLFFLFLYKIIDRIKQIQKYFTDLELAFLNGIYSSTVAITCITFYDLSETYYYIWFIFGLSNIFLLHLYHKGVLKIRRKHG